MFFGAHLKPGHASHPSVEGGEILHISQATLVRPTSNERTMVVVSEQGKEYVVCVLQKDVTENAALDLFIPTRGAPVSFKTTGGANEVHLVGYYEPDGPSDDDDDAFGAEEESESEEEEEDEESSAVAEATPSKQQLKAMVAKATQKGLQKSLKGLEAAAEETAVSKGGAKKGPGKKGAAAPVAAAADSDEEEDESDMEDGEGDEDDEDEDDEDLEDDEEESGDAESDEEEEAVPSTPSKTAAAAAAAPSKSATSEQTAAGEMSKKRRHTGVEASESKVAAKQAKVEPKPAAPNVAAAPALKGVDDKAAADFEKQIVAFLKKSGKAQIALLAAKVKKPDALKNIKYQQFLKSKPGFAIDGQFVSLAA